MSHQRHSVTIANHYSHPKEVGDLSCGWDACAQMDTALRSGGHRVEEIEFVLPVEVDTLNGQHHGSRKSETRARLDEPS